LDIRLERYQTNKRTDEDLASDLLGRIIEEFDPESEHMKGTAKRYVDMLRELTTPGEVDLTVFNNKPKVDEMIVVSPISFHSLCAHHIIPFFGTAHVAYVPGSKLIGLSKIPRLVRETAKGLHVQEVLTWSIAHMLDEALEDPIGVAVVMHAEHMCMSMRGVRADEARTITSTMQGCFLDPEKHARQEFLMLVNGA